MKEEGRKSECSEVLTSVCFCAERVGQGKTRTRLSGKEEKWEGKQG